MIQETKAIKNNLTIVWIHLANAHGAIPHALIAALDHYHIPLTITSYLGDIQLRFKTVHFTTLWQNLEMGIVPGYTVSSILFVMGINLFITASGKEARGPVMESDIQQPPVRGYMDDFTVLDCMVW